jgi:hypothetical protein
MQTAMVQYALVHMMQLASTLLKQADADELDEETALLIQGQILNMEAVASEYDAHLKHLNRAYFVRADLLWPESSPWAQIKSVKSPLAYQCLFRMTPGMLDTIVAHVPQADVAWREGYADETRTTKRPGPVNLLDVMDCVAAALAYLSSTCQAKHLELVFGVGHTLISNAINDGLMYLVRALRRIRTARIVWPTHEEFISLGKLVHAAYGEGPFPVLMGCLVDGFRLQVQSPGDTTEQSLWYNGFTKQTCNENVIMVGVDGLIKWFAINLEGTRSDFTASFDLFRRLSRPGALPPHVAVCGDDAFASDSTNGFMATRKMVPPWAVLTGAERAEWERYQKTVRQGVEWAIRTLTSTWARLRTPLTSVSSKRRMIIFTCLRLHNFIAANVDNHNQLKTVYLEGLMRPGGM